MFTIKKKFKFECTHRLFNLTYESPCKNLHGHSYKVFIEISTDKLNENGMIIDFTELKKFQKFLDLYFDHKVIVWDKDLELLEICKNYNFKYFTMSSNITAENMSLYFCNQIESMFKDLINFKEIKVEVYETENNSSIFTRKFK